MTNPRINKLNTRLSSISKVFNKHHIPIEVKHKILNNINLIKLLNLKLVSNKKNRNWIKDKINAYFKVKTSLHEFARELITHAFSNLSVSMLWEIRHDSESITNPYFNFPKNKFKGMLIGSLLNHLTQSIFVKINSRFQGKEHTGFESLSRIVQDSNKYNGDITDYLFDVVLDWFKSQWVYKSDEFRKNLLKEMNEQYFNQIKKSVYSSAKSKLKMQDDINKLKLKLQDVINKFITEVSKLYSIRFGDREIWNSMKQIYGDDVYSIVPKALRLTHQPSPIGAFTFMHV